MNKKNSSASERCYPDGNVYDHNATIVVAKTVTEIGILPNHAPQS